MHSDAIIMCDMFMCPPESESGHDHTPLLQMTDKAYEQYHTPIKFFLNFRLGIVPFFLSTVVHVNIMRRNAVQKPVKREEKKVCKEK